MRLLPGQRVGPYEVLSALGAGGMGEVYRAIDGRLGRAVALKVLPVHLAADDERARRFLGEARAASAFNHANVATIYDVGESGGMDFIAMELVEGQTLSDRLKDGVLDLDQIVDIGLQLVDALDAAHALGIMHRDIKPANLMLTSRGQVKVLDFGLAKNTGARQGATIETVASHTAAGMVLGTIDYMSPEQAMGRPVDHRSDLFSVGIVLYQMATGIVPFGGASVAESIGRLLHVEPAPPTSLNRELPPEIDRIVQKCLEKDVALRYQSARQVHADLLTLKRDPSGSRAASGVSGVARRHNLPVQLTTFVGRTDERSAVQALVGAARLVTLTGAGGCGKTRLALQVAADVAGDLTDGAWVVDLAPLSDVDLLPQTVATVLNIRKPPQLSYSDAVAAELRGRQLLLVLDNCEHVIDAAAQMADVVLREASDVRILATSREPLGVPGETVWRVPPFSIPDRSTALTAETVLEFEAPRLFVERARTVDPSFAVTQASVATLVDICRRLDGIPLAIELAAARLTVLTLDQISDRLRDRFRLLTGGSRTALPRQRTLEATVDWSYELLSEREQRLFWRLAVFPAAWTLEAAEEVCGGGPIPREDMLEYLSKLVDKSLVSVEPAPEVDRAGGRRYRFLDTVRQYARDRLLRSDEADVIRDRHLAYFVALGRRVELELMGPDQVPWLGRLQLLHDDVRAALDWSEASVERADAGLALATSLSWFWIKRGYFGEGRRRLEHALAAAPHAPAGLRAWALIGLSHVTSFSGDHVTTERLLDEGLSLAREADDHRAVALTLGFKALMAAEAGDFEQSRRFATAGLDAATASGVRWFRGLPLRMLAYAAEREGDYDRASELFEESLALLREAGDLWPMGILLSDLAGARLLQGRYDDTRALAREAIVICEQLGDRRGTAWCLGTIAAAEAAEGRHLEAARLWGASAGLLESLGAPLQRVVERVQRRFSALASEALGEAHFSAAWSEGRSLSMQQAIRLAVEARNGRA